MTLRFSFLVVRDHSHYPAFPDMIYLHFLAFQLPHHSQLDMKAQVS